MTGFAERIGGAPISWGVCEAPGWGLELPADRVLAEMGGLGLRATELGPTGYLGKTAADVRVTLDRHGFSLIGGFLPVPMHVVTDADLAEAADAMDTLAAAGAEVVVLAARSGDGSYDHKVHLSDDEWQTLFATLETLQEMARDRGLRPSLHPHVGTAVESREAVLRVLDGSDVPICLDTGHLLIGGMQPAELLELAANRITHVHLKDVDLEVSATVQDGSRAYIDGVRAGLYTPLGSGDVDIPGIVRALENAGYTGWYVLEQDCALAATPADGEGPIGDARRSLAFLTEVAR
ncbi:sugar phosphate isomerase/epimerase [Actinoplanes sichuanensis]|uniref:TIM barrel protein n=1 Tax=Actinoplanes sichuanensis TaxID=512349 RepID=A0ABW4AWB7_9ACTN|nr:TIM barrel protein [Actinoplanes sichuanensis]BEL04755.1 sugar phosphate isomerase/epimerase [Actinoplanes sichuanensis]